MMLFFINIPRWLLLALIVYAPWAFGSIATPWNEYLVYSAWIIVALWFISLLIRRNINYLNLYALFCILAILAQGFWMFYNARFIYDNDFNAFTPLQPNYPHLPGSIDEEVTWWYVIQIGAFLGIALMICEISQNPQWRSRIINTMVWTGFSVILLGILQHTFDFLLLYPKRINVWPFATYYYHGNAGAYMNLVLPLIIGKLLLSIRGQENHVQRSLWICVAALSIAAPFINASKGATPIAAFILIILALWQIKREFFHLSYVRSWITLISISLMLVIAFAVLIFAIGPDVALDRWTQALSSSGQFARGRILTSEICLFKMAPQAGAWGMGPDTFHIAFPFFTNEIGNQLYGFWRYAHMDYLQTLVEWGWIGCITWGMLFFGGILKSGWNYFCYYEKLTRKDRVLILTVFLALSGIAIHMFYDFPMQIPSIQFYTMILIGLAYGSTRWADIEE